MFNIYLLFYRQPRLHKCIENNFITIIATIQKLTYAPPHILKPAVLAVIIT